MPDTPSTTEITQVATVFVPVADQDRALGFYAEIARSGTPRSGLVSTDATIEDPVPPQFFFRDLDGNRFLIVESG